MLSFQHPSVHPLRCTHTQNSACVQTRRTAVWKQPVLSWAAILLTVHQQDPQCMQQLLLYKQICAGEHSALRVNIYLHPIYIYTHTYVHIYIYLNLLMWLGAYLCLCVCLLLLLCLCACGRAGMEHGHSATKLSSQKRAWSWPAEQYLDSVFMRWTTAAISITALRFMFVCLSPCWFKFHQDAPLCLSKAVRDSSAGPHPSWESGFHSKDATLKLTSSIIIHPYFSDEFV